MADIKIKQTKKGTIKTINQAVVKTEKIREKLLKAKDKTKECYQEEFSNNGTEYAINKMSISTNNIPNNINRANKYGKSNFNQTVKNIQNANQKIASIKKRNHAQKVVKNMKKSNKYPKRSIKTVDRTIRNSKRTLKTTITSRKIFRMINISTLATIKAIKLSKKAIITSMKSVIATTRALISFLIAGGWICVIIITIICLIGMLANSVFGIFLSSEETGSSITVNGQQQTITMKQVIAELNNDFMNKIIQIQQRNQHNEYDIKGNRADWKEILAVYVAEVSNGNNQIEMITLNDYKVNKIKQIFWEMNKVTYTIEQEEREDGTTYIKLHIKITSQTANEMSIKHNFNEEQKNQLAELSSDKYSNMWSSVIYGSSLGSNDIVSVAISQIGNVGGQTYWSWYGFETRVSWCACFVSWCANQCGYIEAGIIPKFAGCQAEGVTWFKACNLWQERGFIPQAGDIIFFDWADEETGIRSGKAEHVGIVEKVENSRVYTIEGNSNDKCRRRNYNINSSDILGYGTPMY